MNTDERQQFIQTIAQLNAEVALAQEQRVQLLDELWKIVTPDQGSWDYPAQVVRYVRDEHDKRKSLENKVILMWEAIDAALDYGIPTDPDEHHDGWIVTGILIAAAYPEQYETPLDWYKTWDHYEEYLEETDA